MLTRNQRTAILELHKLGLSTRAIQQALKISRAAIKKVISAKSPDPPPNVPGRSFVNCIKKRPRKVEPTTRCKALRRLPRRWRQPQRRH